MLVSIQTEDVGPACLGAFIVRRDSRPDALIGADDRRGRPELHFVAREEFDDHR